MSSLLQNIYGNVEQFTGVLSTQDLLEGRFDNNGDNNPIYVGYSTIPNADPDAAVWFIQKIEYSGTAIVRKRLPDDGRGFIYVWTDRATYFA